MSKDSAYFENYKTIRLNEIMEGLKDKQDDQLRLSYKQVCAKLKYMSKINYFLLGSTIDFVGLIKEWHAIIIDFLEYRLKQQSITRFPLFYFMAKNFKAIIALATQQKQTQKKPHQKHKKKFEQKTFPAIFYQQQPIATQQKINKYLKNILLDEVIPQNTQCICCSRILIKNFTITHLNPYFFIISPVLKFEQNKQINNNKLENIFNAVNNNGGGVVVIGAERKQSSINVVGILFKNRDQICKKMEEIKGCLDSIKPACSYRIDAVLVINQDQVKINLQNLQQRFCFRVLIKPYRNNRISYLQRKKKQNENSKQFYFFTRVQTPEKLMNSSSLYKKIHLLQKNQRKRKNSHQNILCYEPLSTVNKQNQFQCISYGIFGKNKSIENEEPINEELKQKKQIENQWKDLEIRNIVDFPCFKFQKQSLLIVGSQNQDKYVNSFINFIDSMEIQYEINHLFPETFKGCARSVWLISHDISHPQLKDSLKQFSQKQLCKKQVITTMPVHTILQILLTKLTPFIEQVIKQKFSQHFSSSPLTSSYPPQNPECSLSTSTIQVSQYYLKSKSQYYDYKHKENKKIYYLKFSNKVKSLFAYMCFQMLQLRPYFVSQKDCKAKF